jgi:hypothetical protein
LGGRALRKNLENTAVKKENKDRRRAKAVVTAIVKITLKTSTC